MVFFSIHIPKHYFDKTVVVSITFFILFFIPAQSQTQDTTVAPTTRQELWPEINLYYRFNDKFRLFGSLSATRLKSSSYTDGGVSVNLDYFALPVWRKSKPRADSTRGSLLWFRGGFSYSTSPKDADDPVQDYSILSEISARFYLPWQILLSAKNRFDLRWRNGDFQSRYRPKITIERDFKTDFLSFSVYTYGEYFVNFHSESSDRLRLAIGWEVRVAKHISFETYFVHQFEGSSNEISVNAIGLALKVYWHKGDRRFFKR